MSDENVRPKIHATILTGFRPDLLDATLRGAADTLSQCDGVTVFLNGGDVESAKVLDECGIDHERIIHVGNQIPNGPATSICASAARKSGADVWLHLEDDWVPVPELVERLPDWLHHAAGIAMNEAVGQVRLREESHLGQLVTLPDGQQVADGSGASNANWIDGRPVPWSIVPETPFMVAPHHVTFNPFVMRTALIGDGQPERPGEPIRGVLPAESERHAMARFYALNLLVAQLRPGVFRHVGGGRSMEGHG